MNVQWHTAPGQVRLDTVPADRVRAMCDGSLEVPFGAQGRIGDRTDPHPGMTMPVGVSGLQRGPSALVGFVPGAHPCLMAWFFRAIETAQGRWECHHGARVFDEHPTLAEALEHLRAIAADQQEAAQLFVHTVDGQVRWESAT
jgi:hypothetical protein